MAGLIYQNLVKRFDLTYLKPDIDGLHIDKLETTSNDLIKLSYVVENGAGTKTVYDKLLKKLNAI